MSRSASIVLGAVALAVLVAIVLLATGGNSNLSAADESGDVEVSKGGGAPSELGIVDIREALVRAEGDDLVFEVTMEDRIPGKLRKEALAWRWELYEGGQMTWLLSANVDLGTNVSVVATQAGYQASTVDESLPGEVEIAEETITVRLDRSEIRGMPARFDWLLKTTLDGDRTKATSAIAEDQAPDTGFLRVDAG